MYDESNGNAATAATLVALNNSVLNNAAAAAANAAAPAAASQQLVNQLLTVKDSRWLMLEVCREYQRGQCSRSDLECKFAHPPATVDVQNGRVTACYDSIKGRCTREKCKYLHPPQHLKDQLLINGRHHLQLKNHLCSQLTNPTAAMAPPTLPLLAQIVQQQQHQQAAMMPTTLAYQYFSHIPAGLYPAGTLVPAGAVDPYQSAVKREALERNMVPSTTAPMAMYSTQTATAQFNPYMQSIQIPAGYIPAVSFNGTIPPRY